MVETSREYIGEVAHASPLTYAVASSFTLGVKLLIESGADVDAAGEDGVTALMVAAALGNRTLVNMLLAAGASVDERAAQVSRIYLPGAWGDAAGEASGHLPSDPVEGASALWLAARAGHSEIVQLLLREGANAHYEASCEHLDKDGEAGDTCSARRAAELAGHKDTAALFERSAKANDVSPGGQAINWRLLLRNMSRRESE